MRRGRRRYELSPTYGTPHPNLRKAKKSSEFAQSVYDAAPEHIRKLARDDADGSGTQRLFEWFYSCSKDPRPKDKQFSATPDYRLPPFPWDSRFISIRDIFG